MGFTNSRGKRPARLHSSIIGTRFSSMNLRAVSRTRRSSSLSKVSKSMKSTPRNLMAGILSLSSQRRQTANGKLIKVAERQGDRQRGTKKAFRLNEFCHPEQARDLQSRRK